MDLAAWIRRHRRSILFLVVLLAAGGGISALRLPVTLFPHVQFPRIQVKLEAGDRPARQTVLAVTRPAERAVRQVRGVRSVRSTTSRGSAELSVRFDWGHDMARALLQVESALNQALGKLPPGTSFTARRMDPTVFPVLAFSLTGQHADPVALRDLARFRLAPLMSRVDGVARVGIQGGRRSELRVSVDPARLQALDLSLADVTRALSANNVLAAVGRMEDYDKLFLTVTDARLQGPGDIGDVVVRRGDNGVVRVHDVARVRRAQAPYWRRVTADGRSAVLLNVYQRPGASVVRLQDRLQQVLATKAAALPDGVELHQWYDQSQLVRSAATGVRDAIWIGVLLAGLVLLVFLRNLRLTFVALIAVPAVLGSALLLLYALGMSLNIMTLGGMAAAVGLIIDDVIVMVEHIARRVHETGEHGAQRVMAAAREFTRPLAGSSLSTVIIFLPLAFLTGVTGAFFKALALTMAIALVLSFLITWLAVPLLADFFLGPRDAWGAGRRRGRGGYARLMVPLFRRPAWLLVGLVPLLAGGWWAYQHVGTGFMPVMDEGGFILDYWTPPGTSLTETDRVLRQIGHILQQDPAVRTYSRRTGAQLAGGITEANTGDFFVRLKDPPRAGTEAVMARVRRKVNRKVAGVDIELAQLIEDEIGDLTSVPQPIDIKLFGASGKELRALAPKVAKAIGGIPGVVDVKDGVVLAGDALRVRVDRRKAALAGITPSEIRKQLHTYLHGARTTRLQQGNKFVPVRVTLPRNQDRTIGQVRGLPLRTPDGRPVPLNRVASVKRVSGQPEIDREDLKTLVAVTGRISGRPLGATIADVKAALSRPGLLPDGVFFRLGGLYRQQQQAFRGLLAVFAAALALVALLLLYLYERFRIVAAIMACPLLAALAVFVGLWATGVELNITAMMGDRKSVV